MGCRRGELEPSALECLKVSVYKFPSLNPTPVLELSLLFCLGGLASLLPSRVKEDAKVGQGPSSSCSAVACLDVHLCSSAPRMASFPVVGSQVPADR